MIEGNPNQLLETYIIVHSLEPTEVTKEPDLDTITEASVPQYRDVFIFPKVLVELGVRAIIDRLRH